MTIEDRLTAIETRLAALEQQPSSPIEQVLRLVGGWDEVRGEPPAGPSPLAALEQRVTAIEARHATNDERRAQAKAEDARRALQVRINWLIEQDSRYMALVSAVADGEISVDAACDEAVKIRDGIAAGVIPR